MNRAAREAQLLALLPEDQRDMDLSLLSDVELNALISSVGRHQDGPRPRRRRA